MAQTLDEIEKTIDEVRRRYRPSSSRDLSVMMTEAQCDPAILRVVRFRKGDPTAHLLTVARPASDTVAIPKVVAELERIWRENLSSPFSIIEDCAMTVTEAMVTLVGVAVEDDRYFTVEIRVDM